MKIGFSFGRCIRDIVNDQVALEDVAFIIAATMVRDEEAMLEVVDEYLWRNDYLAGLDATRCKEVALALWNEGKILQPRLQNLHRHKQPETSIWVDIFPTALSDNQAVKNSWDAYRMMIHMVENVDVDATEIFR
jgi:hypothetical protein